MTPRSTDCEADALTTTPSRRLIEAEDRLRKHSDDEEQGAVSDNDDGASSAVDQGNDEVFVEKGSDSSGDEEEVVDSVEEVDQDDNQILSPGGI